LKKMHVKCQKDKEEQKITKERKRGKRLKRELKRLVVHSMQGLAATVMMQHVAADSLLLRRSLRRLHALGLIKSTT